MLATHTAYELAEWRAHDRVNGLVDPALFDILAQIQEQIQVTNWLIGAAHLTPEDEENPVPAPERLMRPGEAAPVEEDDESDDDEG